MPKAMKSIIDLYVDDIKSIYGERLKAVILYGSYARGDFRADSDVDILILTDYPREAIGNFPEEVSKLSFDMLMDHDIDIQYAVENIDFFNKWSTVHPFYANVKNEGVELYAA